ncbi:MAG: SpoIIE family protein phosphatase [Elainellaceae cyanobacterium]
MTVDNFLDIHETSLNKKGEELCGDKVKYRKTDKKAIIVLSDGLGSGVKANILATLTTEILITMLDADVPLEEVLKTVIATLPVCQVRKIAYSTFTIIQVNRETDQFTVIDFDNPLPLFFRNGKRMSLKTRTENILGRRIAIADGTLERGDFLGAISDGVLYAGMGVTLNFGWGWDNVADYIETVLKKRSHTARSLVRSVIQKTQSLYQGEIGDDATIVGIYVRKRNSLIIFTGPPLDSEKDEFYIEKVLNFRGRKAICGGTTGNIVANYLDETVEIDLSTLRKDLPPIGSLSYIDLVTEGILTISKATEYIKNCNADISRLQFDYNGAYLLAKEILQADSTLFLVGQRINEFYQNPLLPKNISIRRNLIEELVQFLSSRHKEVSIEYC